jgi:DNA polymerase III subunit delta
MPPAAPRNFSFICGQDDFLVGRMGRKRYEALAGDAADEFSREVVNGFALNVDEVEKAVNRFREAVQTVPMFGGRRVIWLKDVNFLADSVTGKAETTLKCVEDLQELLATVNPQESAVLITAAPVDRRRSFPKWCEKNADFALADGGEDGEGLAAVVQAEARALGVQFGPGAMELLLAKTGANTRLLVEEVHKLATHAAEGAMIDEASVAELTPNAAQGEFFEMADAFFSGDLTWTLAALKRHFFAGGNARPILAALQNRNRILIQLRALQDAGDARIGPRGVDGLPRAAEAHASRYGEAAGEKSSYNIFTQNPWYLGKLAGSSPLPPLRRLIDNQRAFIGAFKEVIERHGEEEEVLRDLAVRCLAA